MPFLQAQHAKQTHNIDHVCNKGSGLWIYKERTALIILSKRYLIYIASMGNISAHVADLHLKIITQKRHREKQLEIHAIVGGNKKKYLRMCHDFK